MKRCDECKFSFDPSGLYDAIPGTENAPKALHCRRYPPISFPVFDGKGRIAQAISTIPGIKADHWCGEWVSKFAF